MCVLRIITSDPKSKVATVPSDLLRNDEQSFVGPFLAFPTNSHETVVTKASPISKSPIRPSQMTVQIEKKI